MYWKPSPLTENQQIDILLQEYAVLYELLQWRLTAADRRLFVSGGLLTGVLTAIHALDAPTVKLLLWGLPVLMWVIFSAMVGHARSKEDLLRRIDEIERRVNGLALVELLAFQSRRPELGRAVGGRTGMTAIKGTLALSLALLLCAVAFLWPAGHTESPEFVGFGAWVVFWSVWMLRGARGLQHYRYERRVLIHDPDSD